MKRRHRYVLFGGLLLAAIFFRICRIVSLPLEMHIDEAGLGLNAWSLANFGTDRYGNFLPVCPSNFYGEQSAFYTGFCALLVKLFGLNLFTLRLPGVIMGSLTVLFGALLMREKWGDRGLYTGLVLLAIFPYFIMNSRFALDCNAMLGAVTIALYGLIRLLKKAEREPERKLYGSFLLVGVLFGVVLYTYIIAALVIVLFDLLAGGYYLLGRKEKRMLRFRQLFFLALPQLLLALPLVLVVWVNAFGRETIVTPFFTVVKMAVNRTEEVAFSVSAIPGKLRALLHTLTSDGKYGSSDHYWTMYWWSVPFVIAGICFTFRDALESCRARRFSADICILAFSVAEVLMFLFCGQYNYHINGIFIALVYFCVSGILSIWTFIRKDGLRKAYGGVLLAVYGSAFAGFCAEYYGTVPEAAYQVYGGVDQALSLLGDAQKEGEIYILDEVGEFYFLSNPIPPSAFAVACDELGYITDFGNLHFYEPEVYCESDVYVCNKASGRYYFFSDPALLGHECRMLETEYYYVFYPLEGEKIQ